MGLKRLLIHSATVKRKAPGAAAPYQLTESTVAVGAKCRVVPIDGRLRDTVVGRMKTATHILYFLGSQDVLVHDEIAVVGFAGVEFRLVEKITGFAQSTTAHHLEFLAEEREVVS